MFLGVSVDGMCFEGGLESIIWRREGRRAVYCTRRLFRARRVLVASDTFVIMNRCL